MHLAGDNWIAMVGDYRRGEVVPYGPASATHWVAFIRNERLPGRYATLEEVKAAVEAAR